MACGAHSEAGVFMREQMSGFDIRRMVAELRLLCGGWMKKVYQPHHEQLVIRLNPKEGKQQDFVIVRGKRIYLSNRDRPMPQQPSPFAMLLRKHLGNARFESVEQHGFDRILVLTFDSRVGPRHLVIECFRDGNVILTDESHTIIQPLTHAKYAGRTLKRGEPYLFPPEALDPHTLDGEAMEELLKDSDRDLVRTLAGKANLGGAYANAVCSLADAEPSVMSVDADAVSVSVALQSLLSDLSKGSGAWLILSDDAPEIEEDKDYSEHVVEATPLLLPAHEGKKTIEMPSMAIAIDTWRGAHDAFALARREEEMAKTTSQGRMASSPVETLERRLAQQESALEKFTVQVEKMQTLGLEITDAWTHVESLLHQTREAVESIGWKDVKARVKDMEWIEAANPAERSITAILPAEDGSANGSRVELSLDETVHQNAQRWFEKGRKQKEKGAGAVEAVEVTRRQLAKARKNALKIETSGRLAGAKRSRRLWFENHRWTILDGMHLMVGGRDAKGNDMLVKKHLRSDDRYVHADLHGAASGIMKLKTGFIEDLHPPSTLPEGVPAFRLVDDIGVTEFSEEAQQQAVSISLAWSRAWNAGRAGGTVFWAKPGQVSKTAESGEYIGKGAFIIRGQRNWYRDVQLDLALGLVCINSVPLLMCGERDMVEKICDRWASITPGREKKDALAVRIAKATGLSTDDILPVVPGSCDVGKDHGLLKFG